jgi:hypothetical protein
VTSRARPAAEELTLRGTSVRCLRSIYVPEDQTCCPLFKAGSPAAVREATRDAAPPCARVAEAIER